MTVIRKPEFEHFLLMLLAAALYFLAREVADKYRAAINHGATTMQAVWFASFNCIMLLALGAGIVSLPLKFAMLQIAIVLMLLHLHNTTQLMRFELRKRDQPSSTR